MPILLDLSQLIDSPEINGIYNVQLCSGETRVWKYLGEGVGGRIWWSDLATGDVFNEESIMYAWQLIEKSPRHLNR